MNLTARLILFREYRNLHPSNLAIELGVPFETYMNIEKGVSKMNDMIAEKLSDFYQAPKEFFISEGPVNNLEAGVIYSNCTFVGGSGSSNGYINHQYNDRGIDEILFSKKEEIKRLQEQIKFLQDRNVELIEMLRERMV